MKACRRIMLSASLETAKNPTFLCTRSTCSFIVVTNSTTSRGELSADRWRAAFFCFNDDKHALNAKLCLAMCGPALKSKVANNDDHF